MKSILVLGASGSVGKRAIQLVENSPSHFLSGVVTYNSTVEASCPLFKAEGRTKNEISEFIDRCDPDVVLNAVSGVSGLLYSEIVLEKKIALALANKETLTVSGNLIKQYGGLIIPVDSEHSASMDLINSGEFEKLIITASGGPFRERNNSDNITVEEAINHPVWKMGKKISVDSATMANKGLEVIEASVLFDLPAEKIGVLIHPESVVHSLIEKKDGSVRAFISVPDMSLPIATALGIEYKCGKIKMPLNLSFYDWSEERYPLLKAAYDALGFPSSLYSAAYTISDEVAVNAFISGKISFKDIERVVLKVLEYDWSEKIYDFKQVNEAIDRARMISEDVCRAIS